ncbi:hypothetical protein PDJAM_G00147550 [Pangasius djambal]|uniref:Uncharacterized protein n=1 Tax=Pangasius djambal TaxID=1691987 RepID=A0ACC5ZHF6_9TELE|nr:hypothetical protein [Pangasius djambal]
MAEEAISEQMKELKVKEGKQGKTADNAGKDGGKDGGKKKSKGAGDTGGRTELNPQPQYVEDRLVLYNKLKAEHDALMAEKAEKESKPIKITLPDGKVVDGESWKTTPYQVACGISQGLADNTVIAKVNNDVWDLDRPLERDCSLELLKFDDEEAQAVYWHSSAHIMGEAMERVYGGCLCYGPPIENGFYYDMYLDNEGVSSNDFPCLENLCKKIIKEKQPFERLEVKKETLLEMFKYNKFKCRILNEKVTTPTTTVYRCGPLIDLCRGPHVRHTGKIKALKIHKNSSTYWEGKADMETLQRIYGISFPDPKMLKEWEKFQEEAKNRDHRKLGREQELFFFHDLSPGSCFFLPKGAYLYNTLVEFIRSEYRKRGFQEVVSPNIFNSKLWQTSGHWQHYSENMFSFEVEKEIFALKPMNCPGHCLMFDHRPRSWRELPLRLADFGVLHRNELSGALTGLTRVRRFQQDDAHIFCAMDQIESEIKGCLEFLRAVYDVFGFTFKLNLSTRPEKFLGEPEVWDQAEKQLENSLNEFGEKWILNPGDGAFYGPKIDIQIKDAIGRYHQCATIQLDFQLPIRFNLTFVRAAFHLLKTRLKAERPTNKQQLKVAAVKAWQSISREEIQNLSFENMGSRLQIESEIKGCLEFLRAVYDVFGFTFKLNLSTRPEKFLGEPEVWDQAEKQLENSLNEFGEKWILNPGDGAFYGPKIDIQIKDAIGRYHQCATIQLDFQLPIRFNLTFVSHDGDDKKRPVIIHRAILGSVERMIAILTENYGGKWPLWLSPRQVMVVPVGPTCEDYAQRVQTEFHSAGLMTDVDLDPGCTLNKKIRNAQLAQYNFILVVGEKEKSSDTVNVRTRDNKVHGERSLTDCMERLRQLKASRTRNAEEDRSVVYINDAAHCPLNTGGLLEVRIKVFISEMDFTDEEMMWLLNISSEVPVGKLTPMEERWCELAKPETAYEAQLYQLLASIRFGLTDSVTSSMDILTSIVQNLSMSS